MNLFNIIKNKQQYWLVDQIRKDDISKEAYLQQFTQILEEWNHLGIGYLSLLMDESFESLLLQKKFCKISSIVEYTRKLADLPQMDDQIVGHSLSEGLLDDREYWELYDLYGRDSVIKDQRSFSLKGHIVE
ncbi:hypothetical protein ACQKNX_13005 [Lysinibacillus sp. NPDC093712]|uniref:hypothetical protein n=1 Tax=Lysinibacillus sp. NPDC093712 TaxID=3390579 RepID=UPI003D05881B